MPDGFSKISQRELQEILHLHLLWLDGDHIQGRQASLSKVDCSNTTLRHKNLSGADIWNTLFCEAHLSDVNFSNAVLQETIFRDARLFKVNFEGADLFFADFSGAQIQATNMENANIEWAYIDKKAIEQSHWTRAQIERWLDRGGRISEDVELGAPAVKQGEHPSPGHVLDGVYRILKQIGVGSEAVIYKAAALRDVSEFGIENGDHLIVKYYDPKTTKESREGEEDLLSGPCKEIRRSFRGHQLTHNQPIEGLRRVLEHKPCWVAVLEWVEGESYDEIMGARSQAPNVDALRALITAFLRVVGAMVQLNNRAMVFRDLKPHNIIVSMAADGHQTWTLIDTGLVTRFDLSGHGSLTHKDDAIGTPQYAAPEMLRRGDDHSTMREVVDVYTVGSTLYAIATNRPMFLGNLVDLLLAKSTQEVHDRYPKPENLNPAVDDTLSQIIQRCVQFYPQDRYQTVQEVHTALANWLEGKKTPEPEKPAFERHLSEEDIRAINQAATDCGLVGNVMVFLTGLPQGFIDMIPLTDKPAAHLMAVLGYLNRIECLTDGTNPLSHWLDKAHHLTQTLPQSKVFREALSKIRK